MATAKFFDNGNGGKVNVQDTIGDKFQGVQNRIVPANMEGERFQRDQAKFFGEDAETRSQGSVYQANTAAFYGTDKAATGFKIQASQGVTQTGPAVNTKSGMFKKDAAAFYGHDKFEVESQGTQFQRNAANFMGTDLPESGQRPFKIDKNAKGDNNNSKIKGTSYLNEQRLREHVSTHKLLRDQSVLTLLLVRF